MKHLKQCHATWEDSTKFILGVDKCCVRNELIWNDMLSRIQKVFQLIRPQDKNDDFPAILH